MDRGRLEKRLPWLVAAGLFCLCFVLYLTRMAPSVVPGDPGEYQLIAARWGIGHPPGYGFYALLGNLVTHLVPIGTFAWRANMLSAACGALIVALVYAIGQIWAVESNVALVSLQGQIPSIVGALALATGIDLWQHALHANAHIVTAALATVSLFCLLWWWRLEQIDHPRRDRWLFLFCFVAGLSPVQHPLLVFAFPVYAGLIVAVRPRILMDWRTLLKMVAFASLGLAAYLYYPIRSTIGAPPAPGPSGMHTWAGFVNVVTAEGLRVNLFQFSARQVLQRLWDVRVPLGLQYTLPALLLSVIGLVHLWGRRWRPALLLTGYMGCVVLATVNILQDEMAYLLGPIVVVGVLVGIGAQALLGWIGTGPRRRWITWSTAATLFLIPLWSASVNWTRMNLADFRDADEWLSKVETQLGHRGQQVVVLTEWERMTTVYYYTATEKRMRPDGGTWVWEEADVRFVPISAGKPTPFLDAIDAYLPQGPVYLTTYRPEAAQRYRLMPCGDFWQALPGWPHELPNEAHEADVVAEDRFEIVGWRLNQAQVQQGDVLSLDLYMRMSEPEGVEAQRYYLPWARLGETTYLFTTDSRFHTPWWQPGEIVVERFDLPISWRAQPGIQPLRVGVRLEGRTLPVRSGVDSVSGEDTLATLTEVLVQPAERIPSARTLDGALGNLRGEILLRGARANGQRVPTPERLVLEPGRTLRVVLEWESLRPIEENYTVFVQLLDTGLQVRAQSDMTPLGGSVPTLLWFPRWRSGTRVVDTHLLQIPTDLAPGQYPLVVGMYDFSTHKRVQVSAANGNVDGDWITLGHLWVE